MSNSLEKVTQILCQPGFLSTSLPIRIHNFPMELVPSIQKVATFLGFQTKIAGLAGDARYCVATYFSLQSFVANFER